MRAVLKSIPRLATTAAKRSGQVTRSVMITRHFAPAALTTTTAAVKAAGASCMMTMCFGVTICRTAQTAMTVWIQKSRNTATSPIRFSMAKVPAFSVWNWKWTAAERMTKTRTESKQKPIPAVRISISNPTAASMMALRSSRIR